MDGMISIIAAVSAFAITAVLGIWIIPFLRKLKFGQTILDIGPVWHKDKQGTPTMGGIMFIIGVILAIGISFIYAFVFGDNGLVNETQNYVRMTRIWAGVVMALGMALIGFIDDYIKVVKKRNLGFTARQKTFFQLLLSAGYLVALAMGGDDETWIPFLGNVNVTSGIGLIYWPIALITIYGFVNAVNLTDGVDGLASAVTLVVAGFFMIASVLVGQLGINVIASALAGACMGFLIWNAHPAKVFMGDTGSMFLGGMVVALAFGMGRPILLFLSGIVYLVEAFSVVIQVTYYKRTKKRIFKMSPLHHHFEMSGWSEGKIVLVFSLVALVGSAIALLPVLFKW